MYTKIRKKKRSIFILSIVLIMMIFVVSIITMSFMNFNDHTYVICVTGKDRVYTSDGDTHESKYIVFADNVETGDPIVFENTDTFLRWKWDSSNMQGYLKEGCIYEVTVVGYRIPIFSMYENIIKAIRLE